MISGPIKKTMGPVHDFLGPPLSALNKNLTYKTNSRPGRGGGAIRKFSPWKIGHRVFGLQITGAHFQYCIYRSKDKEFPFLTYM